MINTGPVEKLVIDSYRHNEHNLEHCQGRGQPLFGEECCCWNMPSAIASSASATPSPTHHHTHNNHRPIFSYPHNQILGDNSTFRSGMMDSLNDVLVGSQNGCATQSMQMDTGRDVNTRRYGGSTTTTRMDQSDVEDLDPRQLVSTAQDDLDDELGGQSSADQTGDVPEKGHLAIPEIIEILKNLAACKEKLFKWEQSVSNLESIQDSDPNKSHLMEIIDFVENNKSSTKEKAIYLYEQLGLKCRQHKNYIGAAKAYERAASLRLDISDLNETGDNRESIVSSTIRYLESAIHNYDAIHKFKHAGTLHYRCSKILKMMNASHEEVDRHHEKALEYFTKPDHELKHRKRIDGLKISCYSSFSTLQRMHHEIEKFHTTTTTTTTNTIKFHADGCFRDSEDSDSNHSTTPPPSSSGSAHGSNGPMTPAIQFYGEDRHDYHAHHNQGDFFDSFMGDNYYEPQGGADRTQAGEVHAMENGGTANGNGPLPSMTSNVSMNKSASMESKPSKQSSSNRLHHSHHYQHHEAMSAVKDHHHLYHHHHMAKTSSSSTSSHHRHVQSGAAGSTTSASFSSFQKHHHHKSSSSSTGMPGGGIASSPLNPLHPSNLHKTTFRCIEDRIESARKLVKKLHKLCPFYEVSTNGDDAGRVYCRICDRYLGAVSSTLKNHINTQEHRQAYEDSQQPPGSQTGGPSMPYSASGASGASSVPALPAPLQLPALPAPPPSQTSSNANSIVGSYGSSGASATTNQLTSNSTGTSREDLSASAYSAGSSSNNVSSKQSSANYSSEQQQQPTQPQQLLLQPGLSLSPFMLQASPIGYQSGLQSLDKTGHLSGKYMDFDQLNSGVVQNGNTDQQQQQQMNWAAAAAVANAAAANNPQTLSAPNSTQQYLQFNGNVIGGGAPGVSLIDSSVAKQQQHQQAMAAAVLQMQASSMGHHTPHHYIPATVAALGVQNVVSGGGGTNNGGSNAVLAYH